MIPKQKKAIDAFHSGMNCAQSVVIAYTDEFNFDENLALQISSGFGGGMGRLQKTCGVVTGAFMVLGIYSCKKYSNNGEQKDNNRALIQKFHEKFVHKHNTSSCIELVNYNLNTEEGQALAKAKNVKEKICEKCLTDSIEIIEDLLSEN